MQAITTKYIPPTNHRGSRIKAECEARSIIVDWDYAWDVDANHAAAANRLLSLLGWDARHTLASGTDKQGRGVHVLVTAQ